MAKMIQFFSYMPKSGSRVIAAKPGPSVIICDIAGGTVAVGDIAIISVYTARRGPLYRRGLVRRMAEEIIPITTGLAEDCQGVVTLAVPVNEVNTIITLLNELIQLSPYDLLDAKRQLWRQGLATIKSDLAGINLEIKSIEARQVRAIPGWRGDTPAVYVVYNSDYEHYLKAGVAPSVYTCVTDKGRIFTAHYADGAVRAPSSKVAYLMIYDHDRILNAVNILNNSYPLFKGVNIPTEKFNSDFSFTNEELGLELTIIDDSWSLIVTRNEFNDLVIYHLKDLADEINNHVNYPDWAGWELVPRTPVGVE